MAELNPNNKDKAQVLLSVIQKSIFELQDILPSEQSYIGSELQQIDALTLQLIHKYLKDS